MISAMSPCVVSNAGAVLESRNESMVCAVGVAYTRILAGLSAVIDNKLNVFDIVAVAKNKSPGFRTVVVIDALFAVSVTVVVVDELLVMFWVVVDPDELLLPERVEGENARNCGIEDPR